MSAVLVLHSSAPMIYFLERVLLPGFVDRVTAHECRGTTTAQRNKTLSLVCTANMITDGDIAIIESGSRASVDAYESDIITRPVAAKVTFKDETHDVQSLEKLDLCATTTDHSTITCSCRMGQKGDLCAPKIAAMMKLQKCPAARRFAWESRSQKFPKLLDLKRLIIRLKGAKIPKFHGPFLACLK